MIPLIWAMERVKSTERESGMTCSAGARGEGETGQGLLGKFQFGKLEKFWRPAVQPHVNSLYMNQPYDFKNCQNGKFYIICVVFKKTTS